MVRAGAGAGACGAVSVRGSRGLGDFGGSFSPPIRGPTLGAPGRFDRGDVVLDAAVVTGIPWGNDDGITGAFEPSLVLVPSDWWAVEAGASLNVESAMLGTFGIRLTPAHFGRRDRGLTFDVAFGGGAGVGQLCGNAVDHWYDDDHMTVMGDGPCPGDEQWDGMPSGNASRPEATRASASVSGSGGGTTHFWRVLASSSWAEGVPASRFAALVYGPHFRLRCMEIHFGAGPAVLWNDIDVAIWFLGESSITIGWFRRLRPTRPEPRGVRVSPW